MRERGGRLIIVRHGIAGARGSRWPDDDRRPLTARGRRRMREVARALAVLDGPLDLVLTSPLPRARQTAAILAEAFDPAPAVRQVAGLAPPHSTVRMADAIARAAGGARRVAIVGHEPNCGRLVAWLTGAAHPPRLRKGGVCRVDLPSWPPQARTAELVWLAPPKILRRAGR
jgi:phosphohistidine phosphatase